MKAHSSSRSCPGSVKTKSGIPAAMSAFCVKNDCLRMTPKSSGSAPGVALFCGSPPSCAEMRLAFSVAEGHRGRKGSFH
eukprot:2877391-Prymnesium_polylepis.2